MAKKNKQLEICEKKIEIQHINMRKFKERAKLLTVVIEKVYSKMLDHNRMLGNHQISHSNQYDTRNLKEQKDSASSLLQNTSPIARVFNSNRLNSTISPSNNKDQTL